METHSFANAADGDAYHDSVTPGGKPSDGFVKLSPGNPYVVQTREAFGPTDPDLLAHYLVEP